MTSLTNDSEDHPGFEGWRVAGAAGLAVFFASMVVVTFPVLLKPLAAEFGWPRGAISTAFGLAAGVAALAAAPLGVLLDRIGPRRVAIPALTMLGALFASLALLTPRLAHLYTVFAVLGLAGIGTSPVAYGRAIGSWFAARRGMALAVVITGGALGGMALPPAFEALSRALGWRTACLVLGSLALAIGVPVVARFVRERPGCRASGAETGAGFAAGVRSRLFLLLGLAQFCAVMAQNSVIVHLSALLTDRGVSPAGGALALAAMALAAVAGRVMTGVFIDRVFAVHVLVALMALAAIGAWILSASNTLGAGILAAMLIGFGTGGEADVVPYLLTRYFGLRSFSSLYGLAWTVGAVGGALGPVFMGRTFDAAGSYAPMLVRLSVLVAAAAALAALLPRYSRSAEDPAPA